MQRHVIFLLQKCFWDLNDVKVKNAIEEKSIVQINGSICPPASSQVETQGASDKHRQYRLVC